MPCSSKTPIGSRSRSQRQSALDYPLVVVLRGREEAPVALADQLGEGFVRRARGGGLEFEMLGRNACRPGERGVRENPVVCEPVGPGIGGPGRAGLTTPAEVERGDRA